MLTKISIGIVQYNLHVEEKGKRAILATICYQNLHQTIKSCDSNTWDPLQQYNTS